MNSFNQIINFFIYGGLFYLSITHFLIYLVRKNEKYHLYFSIFTFTTIINSLSFSGNLAYFFQKNEFLLDFHRIFFSTLSGVLFIYYGGFYFLELFNSIALLENKNDSKHKLFYNFGKKYITILSLIQLLIALIIYISIIFIGMNLYKKILWHPLVILSIVNAILLLIYFLVWYLVQKKYNNLTLTLTLIGFWMPAINILLKMFLQSFNLFLSLTKSDFFIGISFILYSIALSIKYNSDYNKLDNLRFNLENLVKKRTVQLEEEKDKKTTFFINLAHETKTPLTLISNYLEKDIKEHGSTENIKMVKQNIDKLTKNIIDFLDVEKLIKGQVFYNHDQIIDISEAIQKSVWQYKDIAKRKGVELKQNIQKNLFCKIAPQAMDQILNNLIDNAIKYTEKGQIEIELKKDNDIIILNVIDTGIGIPKDQLSYIFEPYYQISHEKQNIQGNGMGLNIVNKIVEDLKGKIIVESEPEKGSCFSIHLNHYQLTDNDQLAEIITSTPIETQSKIKLLDETYDKSKKTILIVEDNIEMLAYLQSSLIEQYNIYYAQNGKEALEKLKNIPKPDLVLSDIMMDEMDGFEFLQRLIIIDEFKSMPLIFLTAKSMDTERIKGLQLGAIDYITKPFLIDELLLKITNMLKYYDQAGGALIIQNRNDFNSYVLNLVNKNGKKQTLNEKINAFCDKYKFSQQEKEVFKYQIKGWEYKNIAEKLDISISTVNTYAHRSCEKADVTTRAELMGKFFEDDQ